MASISGISCFSSSEYLCAKQPVTISNFKFPVSLRFANSIIVSIDSCFADSINPHVLTKITSASSKSPVNLYPFLFNIPIIISASTRFFEQPNDSSAIFNIV